MTVVTEALVDANDEAVRGEMHTVVARAVASLWTEMLR